MFYNYGKKINWNEINLCIKYCKLIFFCGDSILCLIVVKNGLMVNFCN